jgi:hypothetical protein
MQADYLECLTPIVYMCTVAGMSPQTNAEYARHPLKLLRALLSPHPDQPISQTRLAKLVDSPPNSIKLAEHGQRSVGETLLARIRIGVGAAWNNYSKSWELAFRRPDGSTIPYTYEWYLKYKEEIGALPAINVKTSLETDVVRKIKLLLARVPEDRWWLLIFRLLKDLESARADFLPQEVNDEFGSTELNVRTRYDDTTGEPLDFKLAGRIFWIEHGKGTLDAWSGKDPSLEPPIILGRMPDTEFDALPGKSFKMADLGSELNKLRKQKREKPSKKKKQ